MIGLARLTAGLLGLAVCAGTAAAGVITIKPVQICDDGGGSCANPTQELFAAVTSKIYAQAGTSFIYLPFSTVNDTSSQFFEDQAEVDAFFANPPNAAANPLFITLYFTGGIFDAFGEANAIPGNLILIDQIVLDLPRIDTIAHEIGHTLGLMHDDPGVTTQHLMRSGDDRIVPGSINDITPDGAMLSMLTAAQIRTVLADPKNMDVTAVPEPGTLALMLTGLTALAASRRRKASRRSDPAMC